MFLSILIPCHLCAVEVITVSTTSTSVTIKWPEVDNNVLITWSQTLSGHCTQNYTDIDDSKNISFKGHSSYMINGLKGFTDYNISVCINDSICDFIIATTKENGKY